MVRVLVVDDEPATLTFLESLLRGGGYLVQTSVDGKAGLEKARAMSPDVVITDVQMPGLSGNQLIAALRADPRLKDAYVIVLTIHGEKADKMRSLLSGADDFIVKPGGAAEILGRMEIAERVLRTRREAREAERRAAPPDPASVAALGVVLGRIRFQLGAIELGLSSPNPAAALGPCREAMEAVDRAVAALKTAPGA